MTSVGFLLFVFKNKCRFSDRKRILNIFKPRGACTMKRRHDTQHNDIEHNDTQQKRFHVTLIISDVQHK